MFGFRRKDNISDRVRQIADADFSHFQGGVPRSKFSIWWERVGFHMFLSVLFANMCAGLIYFGYGKLKIALSLPNNPFDKFAYYSGGCLVGFLAIITFLYFRGRGLKFLTACLGLSILISIVVGIINIS